MSLKIVFSSLQCPKDESLNCEDIFDKNETNGLYCLCDGASESYDSRKWAYILCQNYVKTGLCNKRCLVTNDFVDNCIKQYESDINTDTLSWSQQSAFSRGSYSTLLGVSIHNNSLYIFSVGDSIALRLKKDTMKKTASFPYEKPEQFKERPILISTIRSNNTFLQKNQNIRRWQKITANDLILMMTDAVGEWMLRYFNKNISMILDCLNDEYSGSLKFENLVKQEREQGRLREDDSTILKLEFLEEE